MATQCSVVSAHRAASAIPQMWYRQAEAVAQTVALGHLADGAEVRAETPVVLYRRDVLDCLQGEAAAAPEALAWMVVALSVAQEVTGVSEFNSTFRVPRYTMEAGAVVGQMGQHLWVSEGQVGAVMEHGTPHSFYNLLLQERPTQVVVVEEEHTARSSGDQMAVLALSSYATSPQPATTKAAPRTTITTERAASRARPARTDSQTPRTSAYAPRTTTAHTHKRAPRALRVPPDPRETPSRVATRRRARLDRRHRRRRRRCRHHRHRRLPPPKTRRRRLRRRAMRSSATSKTRG